MEVNKTFVEVRGSIRSWHAAILTDFHDFPQSSKKVYYIKHAKIDSLLIIQKLILIIISIHPP